MIIGVLLIAALAACGIGAASCSLSCSGNGTASFMVFFVGMPVIIFGAIKLIQRITRGPKKQVVEEPLE